MLAAFDFTARDFGSIYFVSNRIIFKMKGGKKKTVGVSARKGQADRYGLTANLHRYEGWLLRDAIFLYFLGGEKDEEE